MMARPKLGEGETQRLQLKISDEELLAIDDWRFANRVGSRSDAVRRLCGIGIEFSRDRERTLKAAGRVLEHLGIPAEDVDVAAMQRDASSLFTLVAMSTYHRTIQYFGPDEAFDELQALAGKIGDEESEG